MTDGPDWVKLPPDVPNALDALEDTGGKSDGEQPDRREQARNAYTGAEPLPDYVPPSRESNLQQATQDDRG